ncbi:MAG: histidine phosphatase family protein [Deltaproteobacteria bacterium]|jgi:phosphohistidine phosphatase|nr:histidine phosphatase family protein [Deltaproteobacteria bacterium]
MKHLILLRHAKSSWKDPSLDDFDRPLNKRGKENAPLMGQRLAAMGERPQIILASPAMRARKTAYLVAPALNCSDEMITFVPNIYEADVTTLLNIIQDLRDIWQTVILVGHNPGLTELANQLAPCGLANVVTCGAVKLEFKCSRWKEIKLNSGVMLYYEYPKKASQI